MKSRKIRRPRHPMPASMRLALTREALMNAYKSRPRYQQNDYIGWITHAKREETRVKRLKQMLDELKKGGRYMNMAYGGPKVGPRKRRK